MFLLDYPRYINVFVFFEVAHLYSDASIGNNIKIWVVKLVELGKELSVRKDCSFIKVEEFSLFVGFP